MYENEMAWFRESANKMWVETSRRAISIGVSTSRDIPPADHELDAREDLMAIREPKDLRKFLEQVKVSDGVELPGSTMHDLRQIAQLDLFGVNVCFGIYVRSMSLLLELVATRNKVALDWKNLKWMRRAVHMFQSVKIRSGLFPGRHKGSLVSDCGVVDSGIASPTAMTCDSEFVYLGYPDGTIARYQKYENTHRRQWVTKVDLDSPIYSLVLADGLLLCLTTKVQLIIKKEKGVWITKKMSGTVPTYPTITDGRYMYSVELEGSKVQVRVFSVEEEAVIYIWSTQLNGLYVTRERFYSDVVMACNGSAMGFAWQSESSPTGWGTACFSLLTGGIMISYTSKRVQGDGWHAWCYDYTMHAHWTLSPEGLCADRCLAALPYWLLGIPHQKPDPGTSNAKTMLISMLRTHMLHFVGANVDIGLSEVDLEVMPRLESMLGREMDCFDGGGWTTLVEVCLICLQVKLRAFRKPDTGSLLDYMLAIIRDKTRTEAWGSTAFLFLSHVHRESPFLDSWNDQTSELLVEVLKCEAVQELVFMYLPFQYPVKRMSVEAVEHIARVVIKCPQRFRRRAIVIAKELHTIIIEGFPDRKVHALFERYVRVLVDGFIQSWTLAVVNDDRMEDSIVFQVLDDLVLILKRCIDSIQLTVGDLGPFMSAVLLQDSGNQVSHRMRIFFDRLFDIALTFSLKSVNLEDFVQFGKWSTPIPATLVNYETEDITKKMLVECVNQTICTSCEYAEQFVNETAEKLANIPIGIIEKRIAELAPIQPQPLNKISRYLVRGKFVVIEHYRSAIGHFLSIVEMISKSARPSFKLAFAFIVNMINDASDVLVCVPKNSLRHFLDMCPVTLYLSHGILAAADYCCSADVILSLHLSQLSECVDVLVNIYDGRESDRLLAPFMSMKTYNDRTIQRNLLLAAIGLSKTTEPLGDKLDLPLRYALNMSTMKTMRAFIRIVRIITASEVYSRERLYDIVLEAIGSSLSGNDKVYVGVKQSRFRMHMCFKLVELCRDLVAECYMFRDYFANSAMKLNRFQTLGMWAVMANSINLPVEGSTVTAVRLDCRYRTGVICKTDAAAQRFILSDEVLDARMVRAIHITSDYVFKTCAFSDLEFLVSFMKRSEYTRSAIEDLFYYGALKELCTVTDFATSFFSGEWSFDPVCVPGRIETPLWRFFKFYCDIPRRLPLFQLLSKYHSVVVGDEWSSVVCERGLSYSSPFHPRVELSVDFKFSGNVKMNVYTVMHTANNCVVHGSYTLPKNGETTVSMVPTDGRLVIETGGVKHTVQMVACYHFTYISFDCSSRVSAMYRFRGGEIREIKVEPPLASLVFPTLVYARVNNDPVPMGSAFSDIVTAEFSAEVTEQFRHDIITLYPSFLNDHDRVRAIHAILCDATPMVDICNVPLSSRCVDRNMAIDIRLLLGENAATIVDQYIDFFEELASDDSNHRVWRNNTRAYSLVGEHTVTQCISFGQVLYIVGREACTITFKPGDVVLPIGSPHRSGIELLKAARNCILIAKACELWDRIGRVRTIVDSCTARGSIIFDSPDVLTVDDFSSPMCGLYNLSSSVDTETQSLFTLSEP